MSGTIRCSVCKAEGQHERGPGTPLVIHHQLDCPEHPRNDEWEAYDRLGGLVGNGFSSAAEALAYLDRIGIGGDDVRRVTQ